MADRRQPRTVRFEPEIDEALHLVCRLDNRDAQGFITEAVTRALLERLVEPEFQDKLDDHKEMINRLKSGDL